MCIYCRDTDEPHRHDAPAVGGDGRGYRIDAGPGPELFGTAGGTIAYVYDRNGDLVIDPSRVSSAATLWRELRDALARIEALEIMVLDLRDRERMSREP